MGLVAGGILRCSSWRVARRGPVGSFDAHHRVEGGDCIAYSARLEHKEEVADRSGEQVRALGELRGGGLGQGP